MVICDTGNMCFLNIDKNSSTEKQRYNDNPGHD